MTKLSNVFASWGDVVCRGRIETTTSLLLWEAGGPGGELIKRPTSTIEAGPLDRRALIKLRRAAASESRLGSSARRLRSRPSENCTGAQSGPAKLWAGVRTNVLIRWGRKLQGLFFCRKNVEKLTATSAPNGLRRRRTLAALAETLHFHWHELQEELLLQWITHSFQSKGHFNQLYWM